MEAGGAASERRGIGVGPDRISALPDAVLGEIVSLLPTSDGARTQVLASRWRHIWRSAPLNLDCSRLNCGHGDLPAVVSRILSSHQGPGRRFRVNADNIAMPSDPANTQSESAAVDAWLCTPALYNLEELDVWYSLEYPLHPLSPSIHRFSTTLRVLDIGYSDISNSTVQGLPFPKLQQLTLRYVNISECSLNHMIGGCPALESLMIDGSFGFHCVRINSPSLTSIVVAVEYFSVSEIRFRELIIENAPRLKRLLHLDQGYQSTTEYLHVSVLFAPKLETLRCVLDEIYLCTKLSFGSTVIQGSFVDSLVVVRTVKILDVTLNHLSLDIVINLMSCFPCLEKLDIQVDQPCPTSERNRWRRKYRNLATCLDIPLKTIMVYPYWGSTSEVNFLTFFVRNAKALESITVVVSGRANYEEFIAKQSRKLELENGTSRGVRFNFTTTMSESYLADLRIPGLEFN